MRARVAESPAEAGLFLALAPMDGVTDAVHRELMTDLHGGASGISMCVSEFVRVTDRPVVPHVLLRHCPELARGGTTRAGVPVLVQILGGAPEPMAATAACAVGLGARGIDINFGCPAKVVNQHDGGAAILKSPCRVETITAAVREAVPRELPVSVKIRLGWDSAERVEEVVRAAENGGATWITIHARTRVQGYKPPVDWHAIGRARRAVGIPVVANGDLCTPEDLERCAEASGCVAFMIGRGAMARPRLFRRIRGHGEPDLDVAWVSGLVREYAGRLVAAGRTDHAALGLVKQWLRLAAPASPSLETIFCAIKREHDLRRACTILNAWARARCSGAGSVKSTPAYSQSPDQ